MNWTHCPSQTKIHKYYKITLNKYKKLLGDGLMNSDERYDSRVNGIKFKLFFMYKKNYSNKQA